MNELDREKKAEELLKDIRVEKPDDDGGDETVPMPLPRRLKPDDCTRKNDAAQSKESGKDPIEQHNEEVETVVKRDQIQRHHKRSLEGLEIDQTKKDVGYGIV